MSARNRPRNNAVKEDFTDELNLWNSILDRIKKCYSIDEKYNEAAAKITQAERDARNEDATLALSALEVLSTSHRDCLKYSEAELKIMNEEPDDLIKNLETLISVRTAMEAETPAPRERHHAAAPPAVATAPAGPTSKGARVGKRKFEASTADSAADQHASAGAAAPGASSGTNGASVAQSGVAASASPSGLVVSIPPTSNPPTSSVASQAPAVHPPVKKMSRSGSTSTKVEQTSDTEGPKGSSTAAASPSSTNGASQSLATAPIKFPVGSEVFYRIRSKDKNDDGEGIICTIKTVLGEGKNRRYEVQDIEPDDNGHVPPPTRASPGSLIAIPASNTGLAPLLKGKEVFARYPQTNTFYKAEVVGKATKKDMTRLKFEGEEDAGTEKEVERRYVLDAR